MDMCPSSPDQCRPICPPAQEAVREKNHEETSFSPLASVISQSTKCTQANKMAMKYLVKSSNFVLFEILPSVQHVLRSFGFQHDLTGWHAGCCVIVVAFLSVRLFVVAQEQLKKDKDH